ncbi:MAG: O-antigen ligase family protein [Pseudomonadota bacterium]|nr:O-antigen ligase family protein [Pseudomonadota bacterium]
MKADTILGAAAAAFLTLCLTLGGASGRGAGAAANGLLQIFAVLLILVVLWTRRAPYSADARPLFWVVGGFVAIGLLSLFPLPPDLWERLPGRHSISAGYRLLQLEPPSLPWSLSWSHTISSLLWLLPPAAMFVAVVQLPLAGRRFLAWVVVAIALCSIALGAAQLLGGPLSELRFYNITNRGAPVGFFANANHLATLLLCALPMVGYIAGRMGSEGQRAVRSSGIVIGAALAAILLVGIAVTGSLAGFGLALPAGIASFLIYRRAARARMGVTWLMAAGAFLLAFLAVAVAGPLSSEALSDEVAGEPASRAALAGRTLQAVKSYFPAGSGLGTFVEVYRTFDDPNRVDREYANHAHNDYLEVALELGLPGIVLVLGFAGWWAFRSAAAWKSDLRGAGLGRAGSLIIAVVLLHSVVDYPIRTSAIAAVFALACGFLVPFRSAPRKLREPQKHEPLRHMEAD